MSTETGQRTNQEMAGTLSKEKAGASVNGGPKPAKATLKQAPPARSPSVKESKKVAAGLRSFPSVPFKDAIVIGEGIQKFGGGVTDIRRLTLFEKLGKGADSSISRSLVTNSSKYGITTGSHSAEKLSLTPDGTLATDPDASPPDRLTARFKLAIQAVEPFNTLYEKFHDKRPIPEVMRDHLLEQGYQNDVVPQLVETFVLNAKFLGLLQELAGAERLLSLEHVLEEMPKQSRSPSAVPSLGSSLAVVEPSVSREGSVEALDWERTCFYVTPIGNENSEERQHSDLFLSHIVEPVLQQFGLRVIRADAIAKPGMITAQNLGGVVRSKLVIADLSYHNPNVYYELCLRHVCRKPTVHLIRHGDELPANVNQFRTITIDNRTIYTLLPKLETYRAELASQVRRVLEDPDAVENPISTFFPGLRVTLAEEKARARSAEPGERAA